jgi:predicted amidohydrolase YtcJ
VIHPDDIVRFRDLGVAANMQPSGPWPTRRAYNSFPRPSPVDVAIPVQFAARERSSARRRQRLARIEPEPVARHPRRRQQDPDWKWPHPEPFLPDEGLTLVDALAAYTIGSAWVSHLDDQARSIQTGKYADLVVLGAGRGLR